jgi:FlaA1/EpsC-like NDP-sugar epimerase
MNVNGKRIIVTGGTGSLGQALVQRLLGGEFGEPAQVTVFSRDEARQHAMRLRLMHLQTATDEVIFRNAARSLVFRIGDVRNPESLRAAITGHDIIINAAAMKQVPTCEYFPEEAHLTNVVGAINLMCAVREMASPPEVVVGVSTDKAVKPVNVMGLTKALQERVFIRANLDCPATRFITVRYGNVLASRGSVVPLFLEQIARGGPLTITDRRMTRFLMSLDDAVDTIADAIAHAEPGEITVPRAPAARMIDLAHALADGRELPLQFTGIRPGEKLHEILISEEEVARTQQRGDYFAVRPMLPELAAETVAQRAFEFEYSSADHVLDVDSIRALLAAGSRLARTLNDAARQEATA